MKGRNRYSRQRIWVRALTIGTRNNGQPLTGRFEKRFPDPLPPNAPKIKRYDDTANRYEGEPLPFTLEREFKTENEIYFDKLIGLK